MIPEGDLRLISSWNTPTNHLLYSTIVLCDKTKNNFIWLKLVSQGTYAGMEVSVINFQLYSATTPLFLLALVGAIAYQTTVS